MRQLRQQYLGGVRSMVVKLGTQLLSDASKKLDLPYIATVANQVVELRRRGIIVSIVSSGAIGAGLRELNMPKRPSDMATLQAVAAVGQRRLMDAWAAAFAEHSLPVAQILITRDDIDRRGRFLNLRNTLHAAHKLSAIPIINENDTVSTDELARISFGDNDILAALVTQALHADLLVLLTVVDGLLDDAQQPVRLVRDLAQAQQLVRKEKSALGKGGMNSKLEAARLVTGSGEALVVADGRAMRVLPRLLEGEELGTLFMPQPRRRLGRSRWISSARASGAIVIDQGAVAALVQKNRSLLPAGVVGVEGSFDKGDLVEIKGPDGRVVARGLCNYDAQSVARISGKKTSQVRQELGEAAYDEVVHRDNLVLAS